VACLWHSGAAASRGRPAAPLDMVGGRS